MEDDVKLYQYSLPEGASISALLEPDVDINIEVTMGFQAEKVTLLNTTSVMALKVQICGIMRCGVTPEKLEIKLGDDTLEDPMPLHFYGIKNGTKLELLKPYVDVTIENNFGNKIYWRLRRKDLIKDVKVKVASTQKFLKPDPRYEDEINKDGTITAEGLRIYLMRNASNFIELDDDETVECCTLKDGDKLFLLSYRWLTYEGDVTVRKNGAKVQGVEIGDTCLAVKLRVQDQMGLYASTLNVFDKKRDTDELTDYFDGGKQKEGLRDEEKPFKSVHYSQSHLIVITDEELQAAALQIAAEQKAKQKERKPRKARSAKREFFEED